MPLGVEKRASGRGRAVPAVNDPPPPAPPAHFRDAELPEEHEEGDFDFGNNHAEHVDDTDWDEHVRDEDLFGDPMLEENRGDVLVSRDLEYISERGDESTVETDGEIEWDWMFEIWGKAELRDWLKGHAVPYARRRAKR